MARLTTTDGLSLFNMGSTTITSGMRYYGWSKATTASATSHFRFTIGASNPPIHITMKIWYAFRNVNDSSSYVSAFRVYGIYVDTSGNVTVWNTSGDGIGNTFISAEVLTSSRQADIQLWSPNVSSGFISGTAHILCNKWNFVTITQL
jgi:hypothetical protein